MTKYNKITPEIAEKLQAIVGAKRFFAKDAVKDDFSHDEMPIYGKYYPEVVCEVESTEEVSQIMRLCYENNIPVTPRGAGTGLVGGCVPLCGGVVLCTTRMNKILSYDMNNLVVHIQPGVLLCDLAADALTRGLMYPPDPGEKTATVGGNVSTNAGGMRAVKYGVTRDYVLAMTVVLPDGRVMELGKTVCKTSSGYSLLHLMIGSEGTLGIITELMLYGVVQEKAKGTGISEADQSFIADFYKYSFTGVMLDWIKDGMKVDYHMIAEKMHRTMEGNVVNSIRNFEKRNKI